MSKPSVDQSQTSSSPPQVRKAAGEKGYLYYPSKEELFKAVEQSPELVSGRGSRTREPGDWDSLPIFTPHNREKLQVVRAAPPFTLDNPVYLCYKGARLLAAKKRVGTHDDLDRTCPLQHAHRHPVPAPRRGPTRNRMVCQPDERQYAAGLPAGPRGLHGLRRPAAAGAVPRRDARACDCLAGAARGAGPGQ